MQSNYEKISKLKEFQVSEINTPVSLFHSILFSGKDIEPYQFYAATALLEKTKFNKDNKIIPGKINNRPTIIDLAEKFLYNKLRF